MAVSSLNLREALARVVADLEGPISRAGLIDRVLALHPSQARRPSDLVLAEVRQQPGLVRLEEDAYAPIHWVLHGIRFRYVPTAAEVARGAINLFPCFVPFLLTSAPTLLDDKTGREVSWQFCSPVVNTMGLQEAGGSGRASRALHFIDWLGSQGLVAGDSLLLTIEDARQGIFRLRHEQAENQDRAAIAVQDSTLEAVLARLVDRDPSGQPFLEEIVPAALARMHDAARAYPGSHWYNVVMRSSRLRPVDDYAIARATFRRPIDRLLGYRATPAAQKDLETRIDALAADLEQVEGDTKCRPRPAPKDDVYGPDEALRRSTRQIASFLARARDRGTDCYRSLALPAIYLAKYEGVSLADAEWPMLCRFLLSYYPRRVLFNRKAFTARMIRTLRQFYASQSVDGVSPRHLSRLHPLIDRKVALFAELEMSASDSARLFGKLFPDSVREDHGFETVGTEALGGVRD